MKVLVATTAGAGHFAGAAPFARACAAAGHDVRVAAPASFAGTVQSAGFVHEPLADVDPAAMGAVFGRIPQLTRAEANVLVATEVFGRLDTRAALPAMRELFERWRPDVVLREPCELSSYVVASERGVPHVQTNIGLHSMDDHFLPLFGEPLREVDCDPAGLRTGPRWTLLPPTFDEPASTPTGELLRARELADEPGEPLPDWWPGGADLPLVYVTFGSVAADVGLFPGLYDRTLELLRELPARVLLTTGRAADPADLQPPPPNVHVERWWPQRDVMPQAAVLVGHGGFGTTLAGLAAGVPQVAVPLFSYDQFTNAARIAAVGVGVAVADCAPAEQVSARLAPEGPPAVDSLADAVRSVLAESAFQVATERIAAEMAALPTTESCVASLADLVGTAPRTRRRAVGPPGAPVPGPEPRGYEPPDAPAPDDDDRLIADRPPHHDRER